MQNKKKVEKVKIYISILFLQKGYAGAMRSRDTMVGTTIWPILNGDQSVRIFYSTSLFDLLIKELVTQSLKEKTK